MHSSDGFDQLLPSDMDDDDMDGEEKQRLYSVKWYKDNEEFYRYVPKSNPPQQSYRVEGIRVDVSIHCGQWVTGRQAVAARKNPRLLLESLLQMIKTSCH